MNKSIKKALLEVFEVKVERTEWLQRHPYQCCRVAALIQWFNSTEHALLQLSSGCAVYLKDWYHLHLGQLATLVTGVQQNSLSRDYRCKLTGLI